MPPHKRAAEAQAAESSKKTRFVEPAEDPGRFEDEVEASLEGSARQKRKVDGAGYDSDSSDDGESVVRSRVPAAAAEAADDDDEDMFAPAADKAPADEPAAGKNKDEFMRLGDIEGQEFHDGEDSDASSDEPEDEDDAARRAKAGMGFALSSFNMREEMEEGKFTADGAYVRSVDANAQHDRWMEGLDAREIKRARRRKRERERDEQARQKAEERELADAGGKPALERELLALLKRGESVLEALQRLGQAAKRAQKAKPKRAPNAPAVADKAAADKAESPIEHVTHLASMLMSLGDTDIYSRTYEELVRAVRKAGIVPDDWAPPSADARYEYVWAVPDSTAPGQVLGPYSEDEMKAWHNAGFFGSSADKIQVRTVGGSEWGMWDDVVV